MKFHTKNIIFLDNQPFKETKKKIEKEKKV